MGMTMTPARTPYDDRLATPLLVAHVALILFSTFALTTFLAGVPPEWLQAEASQRALRFGWKFSGPTYVVLAALAALAHAAARVGWRRAVLLMLAGSAISLAAELTGTSTGLPFGPYSYTPLLGWRVAGLVPFPIPLSWFYMIYGSLAILGRLLPARDDRARGSAGARSVASSSRRGTCRWTPPCRTRPRTGSGTARDSSTGCHCSTGSAGG
jgi:uncharacterized membrane protein